MILVALAPQYPATRYEPSPLVDLSTKAERERLSPAAIKAFLNIMAKWGVRDEDARALLGGISNGQFYEMKKNPERTLDVDTLTRISYLIGIFKALNIIHSKKLADAWLQRANANRIFGGQTPLAYMIKGGLPAMQTVRRLADARRGGM
jgi:Antitoxin Xre-like helix-turn-helix domain